MANHRWPTTARRWGALEQQSSSLDAGEPEVLEKLEIKYVDRRAIVRNLEARLDPLCPKAHRLTARSTSSASPRPTGPGLPGKRAERSKHMTSPHAEQRRTAGLRLGGGIPPGETPPAEGSTTSGISFPEPELRKGWAAMPLVLIMLVVALIAVGLIAMAVALMV
ncbi:DUF6480 family protein [Streptomyces sp. PTD9-10]|uniref:DUF6480 family protein n=2 Tax=unclassified Streptomyces TaxID=2593676 RepID=UPI00300AC0D9